MKECTCCFTGHRRIPAELLADLAVKVRETIISLISQGFDTFCTGGALGFDTLAAQTILDLKKTYPHIRLFLVLPCCGEEQTKGWNAKDVAIYDFILSAADQIEYGMKHYQKGCMFRRNRRLVELSSVCVCFLIRGTGGTAYTVEYARSHGVKIIYLKE